MEEIKNVIMFMLIEKYLDLKAEHLTKQRANIEYNKTVKHEYNKHAITQKSTAITGY